MAVRTTRDRPHLAVLRTATTSYGPRGRPTFNAAEELAVRWEEVRSFAIDNDGQRVGTDATVWVDREIPVGSEMWLGSLDLNPTPATGKLFEVLSYDAAPDLKGRRYEYTVTLRRKSDTQGDAA